MKKTARITSQATSSSARPLYSPRRAVLRALLILLIAGFVICYETFSRLSKPKSYAAAIPAKPHFLQ
jgi:hypothetical protein